MRHWHRFGGMRLKVSVLSLSKKEGGGQSPIKTIHKPLITNKTINLCLYTFINVIHDVIPDPLSSRVLLLNHKII